MIKKKRVIGFILVLLLIIVGIVFFIVSNRNSNAFSVSEKKWIENNKNNVIDIAVLNDLPYFGVNGEGIFFDYITALEKETGLKFNLISYNVGEKPLSSDFAFKITSESGSDDSSFYTDNYVVLGSNTIFNVSELQGKTVGILKDDINLGSYYLEGVTLTSYDDTTSLLQAYAAGTISYAVIPYLQNIKTILAKDYNIAYQLNDMSNKYVITANSKEEKLNSILKKYFNTWMEESYAADYKVQFMDYYFMAKGIDDQTKATLLSKTYTYGYTSNLPYEKMASGKLVGINSKYLRDFADLTGVQFIYKKYSSLSEISSALKNGKIDISFGYMTSSKLNATLTPEVYKSEYVVLTNAKNSIVVDSLKSLNDSVIKVIADSSINSYLKKESKATIKSYTTIGNLLGSLTKNSIVMIDRQTYDYYKDGKLKNFTVVYENKLNSNYGFEISNKRQMKYLANYLVIMLIVLIKMDI